MIQFQSEKPQNDDDKSWQIHDSQCIIRFFDSIDNPLDTENAAFKESKKKKVLFRETQELRVSYLRTITD